MRLPRTRVDGAYAKDNRGGKASPRARLSLGKKEVHG